MHVQGFAERLDNFDDIVMDVDKCLSTVNAVSTGEDTQAGNACSKKAVLAEENASNNLAQAGKQV